MFLTGFGLLSTATEVQSWVSIRSVTSNSIIQWGGEKRGSQLKVENPHGSFSLLIELAMLKKNFKNRAGKKERFVWVIKH